MLKLGVRLTLALLIFLPVFMGAALLIGRSIDTYVITAQFSTSPNRVITTRSGAIVLIDLPRSLRGTYRVPIADVYDIELSWGSYNVFVSVRDDNQRDRVFERGLYRHNIFTGETDTILHKITDRYPVPDTVYYPRAYTDNGEKMALFEPGDKTIVVYNFKTNERRVLWQFEERFSDSYMDMNWSSDGTRLAVNPRQMENQLYIFSSDGRDPIIYPVNTREFSPFWTENDQYISLVSFSQNNTNAPIDFIRVADGTEHPFTVDLTAINPNWWGCENRWLTYVSINENNFREGYILNMETGEKTRVNDHPLLQNQSIDYIWTRQDCESFTIDGYAGNERGFPARMRPLYYADASFENVQLIDDYALQSWVQNPEENTVYYQKDNPDTGKTTVYKRTLEPFGAPVEVREYDTIEGYVQWTEDTSLAVYNEQSVGGASFSPSGGKLVVYRPETGEKRYLTRDKEFLTNYSLYRWQEVRDRTME